MARVRITQDDSAWQSSRDALAAAEPGRFTEGELSAHFRIREAGGADQPQLLELRYEPHAEIQVHAHDEDEIIYVLAGEMHVGGRVLRPGASLAISGKTFYGFKAGPNGLQFLNFRPRQDTTFYTSKESL